ncbi:adenosine deaminase/editase [Tuber brumale]|nr:adenosine deaminase/editase [Tuber brumale]
MDSLEDRIASTVLSAYADLPNKSKPLERGDTSEWVPLSGVVLECGEGTSRLTAVALGTGMKCLPKYKIPLAGGMVLHDSHAEVLAIRGLNYFLLEECKALSADELFVSRFIRRRSQEEISQRSPQPFTLRESVLIHFYSSEAPCGDASMELTMAVQDDPTPWTMPSLAPTPFTSPRNSGLPTTLLQGRQYFSELGIVRTKPGRADSPPTLSKSCSDKLSLRQVTSALLSPTTLLISPENAYILTVILPTTSYCPNACTRAFGATGRMAPLVGRKFNSGYKFSPFAVRTTNLSFGFSKKVIGTGAVGSNISAVWVRGQGVETLIGGVLQGRKQFASGIKGASMLCKIMIWRLAQKVAEAEGVDGVSGERYGSVKLGAKMAARNEAKEVTRGVLGGWVRNGGDDFGNVQG